VQNAIFKIHRSVLSGYSTVFQDMLDTPNKNELVDGTDERPLVLTGDDVAAWELLFSLQYDTSVSILISIYRNSHIAFTALASNKSV
jgi:hypothetical protein